MNLKIKKRNLGVLAVFMLFLTLVPIAYPAFTGVILKTFGVSLTIFNQAPAIKFNNVSFAVDPIEGTTTQVLVSFNVTDADGVAQINASKIVVNFTLGNGGQWRDNVSATSGEFGTCKNHTESTRMVINCTINMYYYDNASANWGINVTIMDINGGLARNGTTFTYNTLSAMATSRSFVNFSTVTVGQQNVPASPYIVVNNTGNDDFDQINVSAMALIGVTTPSENIAVTNFYANYTNETAGNGVPLASGPVTLRDNNAPSGTLQNLSLIHGHTSAYAPNADTGNITLFFWVDVPSSGLSAQAYNATWNITVVNNP